MDRELVSTLQSLDKSAKTIAESLKKLADEPLVEVEPAPPQCPNCGQLFPTVVSDDSEDEANEMPISEIILTGKCKRCSQPVFAVPVQWVVHQNRQEALDHMQSIKERSTKNG